MAQLWKGRFKKELAKETNDFNSSIKFDSRMFEEDIKGSIAHATMLGATGIIEKSESDKILLGRFANANEVADAIYFLASNTYVNDCILKIDGGIK